MGRWIATAVLIGMCTLQAGATQAAESADPGLGALLAASADRHPTPASLAEGPAGVLSAALGIDAFPAPCGSTILMAAMREPAPTETLRQALATLTSAPLGPDERVFATRDGRFAIHYAAGGPGLRESEVAPETVARVAEALVAARSYLSGTLGYADPAVGAPRVPVYLVRLGRGLEGYLVPAHGAARAEAPFIVLDAALSADRIMPAILHQVAHLSLTRMADSEPWWQEASASFLTLLGTGDLEAQRDALRARLQSPSSGLSSDGLLAMQGALIYPLFLAERSGDPDLVRRIWSAMGEGGLDPLQATDAVLARGTGDLHAAGVFRELTLWTLFTGERDDGLHFRGARGMPEGSIAGIGPSLPLRVAPIEPVEPLGSVAFRLPAERARGSLDLEITAHGGRPAADLLVYYHGDGARPVLVPLDLETGDGRVSLPWGQAREAWIVLRNEARPPDGGTATFEIGAALDDRGPYDLASFTAESIGSSVVLTWTTAREKGLVGWNVHRAEAPAGPFTRLNGVAVPAYGDGDTDTGYVFVDDGARPGRRYYYLVEGITTAGLVERSHLTSARTPAR